MTSPGPCGKGVREQHDFSFRPSVAVLATLAQSVRILRYSLVIVLTQFLLRPVLFKESDENVVNASAQSAVHPFFMLSPPKSPGII